MQARTGFVFLVVLAFVGQVLSDCANDPNAELGCDETCSRRCSPPTTCRNKCDSNTCRCKDGFLFRTDTYKCVAPQNCNCIAREIGQNYRTIPTFEKGLFEHLFVRHYSLNRNELLKCRWTVYKRNIEGRVFAPFQFPDHRDLHFHNGTIRFQPSESIFRYPEHRMKLKPGPGVDFRGQMPIPQEMMMKRGNIETVNDKNHRQKIKSAKKKISQTKHRF